MSVKASISNMKVKKQTQKRRKTTAWKQEAKTWRQKIMVWKQEKTQNNKKFFLKKIWDPSVSLGPL